MKLKLLLQEDIFNLFDKAETIYKEFCVKAITDIKNKISKEKIQTPENINKLLFKYKFLFKKIINERPLYIIILRRPTKETSQFGRDVDLRTKAESIGLLDSDIIHLYYSDISEIYDSETNQFPFIEKFASHFVHEYTHILHSLRDDKSGSTIKIPSKREVKRNDWTTVDYTDSELDSYFVPTERTSYINSILHEFYAKIRKTIAYNLSGKHNDHNFIFDYIQKEFDLYMKFASPPEKDLIKTKPKYVKKFLGKLARLTYDRFNSQDLKETWEDKFDNFIILEDSSESMQATLETFERNVQFIRDTIKKEGTEIPYNFEYLDANILKNIQILHRIPIKQYLGSGAYAIIFELESGMVLKISIERRSAGNLVSIYKRIQDMLHSGEATSGLPLIYDVAYINNPKNEEHFDQFGEPFTMSKFFYILMQKYDVFRDDFRDKKEYPNEEGYHNNRIKRDKLWQKDREKLNKRWYRDKFEEIFTGLENIVKRYFDGEEGVFDLVSKVSIEKIHDKIMDGLIKNKRLYGILRTKKLLPSDIKKCSNLIKTIIVSHVKNLPTGDTHVGNFGTTYNDSDTFIQFDY